MVALQYQSSAMSFQPTLSLDGGRKYFSQTSEILWRLTNGPEI